MARAPFLLGTYGFASRATLGLTDMLLSLLLFATWWCVYLLLEEGARAPCRLSAACCWDWLY